MASAERGVRAQVADIRTGPAQPRGRGRDQEYRRPGADQVTQHVRECECGQTGHRELPGRPSAIPAQPDDDAGDPAGGEDDTAEGPRTGPDGDTEAGDETKGRDRSGG